MTCSPSKVWIRHGARTSSPSCALPLMRFAALQSIVCTKPAGSLVPLHPFALVVSVGAAVFLSVPSPVSCEKGSSSRERNASPESCRTVSDSLSPLRTMQTTALPGGWPALFATSPDAVAQPHSTVTETPSSRFSRARRPCAPGFAGLFHPAATSRVHSSGVLPLTQPFQLVAESCPLVVGAECC